jgi:transposase
MSLKPSLIKPVPELTARIAHTAFPKGNPYLKLRDELGTLYDDEDFADLFPRRGQPGLAPWRLALVTVLQFRENLADRQAAEAVRARIDWKYLLGLELSDPGFDFSVLSEFRGRLIGGEQEALLLERLLERCREVGLLKARGRQRTDATHVLASIRVLNRLELVAETLRAALNEVATLAPEWLQSWVPPTWYERYAKRIEDSRLPKEEAERESYAQTVGEDGLALLDALETAVAPAPLRLLSSIEALRQAWQRHYERGGGPAGGGPARVRFKAKAELPRAAEGIESPYDPQARYRTKRDTCWTGYMVHLTETCEEDEAHLITHVHTTTATVHEARCTAPIQQALVDKHLAPSEHLVDAGYVDAELLASSQTEQGITLRGPTRENPSWQHKVEGAYAIEQFEVDWDNKQVRCPQGKLSASWSEPTEGVVNPRIAVVFRKADCDACDARPLCTRSPHRARQIKLLPQPQQAALTAARQWYESEQGRQRYARRAGIEGTLSQGVRAFGLRQTRYCGLVKTHLQHIATAAAINIDRLFAWLTEVPRAATRTSRFAALAP